MNLQLIQLFSNLGFSALGFIVILLFLKNFVNKVVDNQSKQIATMDEKFFSKMDNVIHCIRAISLNVGKTQLSVQQSITVFRSILSHHIKRKLDYSRDILIENNIKARKEEIKENLRSMFYQITSEESEKLREFNTPAGDMGAILTSIDFEEFMEGIFKIFFTDFSIELKLRDLEGYMNRYVNRLVEEIKIKAEENRGSL